MIEAHLTRRMRRNVATRRQPSHLSSSAYNPGSALPPRTVEQRRNQDNLTQAGEHTYHSTVRTLLHLLNTSIRLMAGTRDPVVSIRTSSLPHPATNSDILSTTPAIPEKPDESPSPPLAEGLPLQSPPPVSLIQLWYRFFSNSATNTSFLLQTAQPNSKVA